MNGFFFVNSIFADKIWTFKFNKPRRDKTCGFICSANWK